MNLSHILDKILFAENITYDNIGDEDRDIFVCTFLLPNGSKFEGIGCDKASALQQAKKQAMRAN